MTPRPVDFIEAYRPCECGQEEERAKCMVEGQYIGQRQIGVAGPARSRLLDLLSIWERRFLEKLQ